MENYPLISVLVASFNNQDLIYETLESIFNQTYPNVEIVVGDDCSRVFDPQAMGAWIEKNKTPNITNAAVIRNNTNLGTVANIENLQKNSHGEFMLNIAADDTLYDEDVLMNLYHKAAEIGDDAQMIISQTELWDHELKYKLGDFISEADIEFIKKATPLELFAECSWHAFLPASYLYRRSLLTVVGCLSEKYSLVEDWTSSLIITRSGIKPYYADITSIIKHRDGGISHGNKRNSKLLFSRLYHDYVVAYDVEIEPYLYLLNEADRERAVRNGNWRAVEYYGIHLPAAREEQKMQKYLDSFFGKVWIVSKYVKELYKEYY